MVRIWGRLETDNKIICDTIYETGEIFCEDNFNDYISSICERLNISTPVILSKHLFHYNNFSNAVFYPIDFLEDVSFDKFIIEDASNY